MARQAKVDLVNAQKDILVTPPMSVTWHNNETPKAATITVDLPTAAADVIIDLFKTRAKSTTEIIPKHDFTIPPPEPDPPIESGKPLDNALFQQARREIKQEDKDAIDVRVNARYDTLGGTREP